MVEETYLESKNKKNLIRYQLKNTFCTLNVEELEQFSYYLGVLWPFYFARFLFETPLIYLSTINESKCISVILE